MSNYDKNIEALKKSNPEYVEFIESDNKYDWITIIKNRNSDLNIQIKAAGKLVTIYDFDNPRKRSREMAKERPWYKEDATILIGMGLGHYVKSIITRREKDHKIIVVEPIAEFVKQAFKIYDFSAHIANGTLLIAKDTEQMLQYVGMIDNFFVINMWSVFAEEYCIHRAEDYQNILKSAYDSINQIRCNTGTVMGAGAQIAQNDIANMPYVIRCRGIAELKDLYKGMPAVVVSTGPSLSNNIHRLMGMQDKVIIIAVAQALRILLAYDIRPDFICSVDFGDINYGHFEYLFNEDIPFICLNRTYAPILKRYKGPKFVVATPQAGYEGKAIDILIGKGFLDQGGSVSHMALSAAIHIGCDPCIIIGQDLALTGQSHNAQADQSGKIEIEDGTIWWKVDDPRSKLKKEKISMGPVSIVPGYFGPHVITNVGLASFITSFETIAKDCKSKLINATEGGARLKGFAQMSLKKALETYCCNSLDKSAINPLLSYAENGDELIEDVIPKLEDDIEVLSKIIEYSEKGLQTDDEMLKHITDEDGAGFADAEQDMVEPGAQAGETEPACDGGDIRSESADIQP